MSSQFFKWKSISIEQNDLVLKVGTDAILLGSWITKIILNPLTILDVGTGSGVIALMLSESFPDASVTAIDTDENAITLADNNFRNNLKHHTVIIRNEDVTKSPIDDIKYDLIVSNPPYFFGQLHANKQQNINAKHAVHNHDVWLQGCVQRLAEYGDLCVIIPFENTFQWIRSANDFNLHCHTRVDVKSFEKDIPVRSMLHFKKALVKPRIEELTIYHSLNTYTQAYLELTGLQPEKKIIK